MSQQRPERGVRPLQIRRVPITHADAAILAAQVQQEYTLRYGGPDETPLDPGMFDAPQGAFFVGYVDLQPVAMGGWRVRSDLSVFGRSTVTEIKRSRRAGTPTRPGPADPRTPRGHRP